MQPTFHRSKRTQRQKHARVGVRHVYVGCQVGRGNGVRERGGGNISKTDRGKGEYGEGRISRFLERKVVVLVVWMHV